ncbi:MAG: ABC transporter substrate-binding protein [Candidatus Eisenbacteria bacterium]|nr:ABC transporter substrate-binding protein [Candidatus Eisenbacteria bacterium]
MRRLAGRSAVVLGVLLLAGCGGTATREKWVDKLPLPADTLTMAMAEPGVHGGRFVVGATSSPKTFNPIMSNENSSTDVIQRMFVALTDIDYMTQADIPVLAKSWTISEDGRTVTYTMRRGACFSDGHPITSDDVKFSFDVVMDPVVHPSMQDGLKMEVDGKSVPFTYSAPDSYTFVVTSPMQDALLLSHIANVRVVPRHILEPAFKAGSFAAAYNTATPPESLVTSGAWKLGAYAENEKTVLARNPYWFGVDAKGKRLPYLDEIVFRVAKDQDAASQMFHAGELDGLDNVKTEDYQQFMSEASAKGFTLHDVGPSFNTNFIWFNLHKVREAGNGKKVGSPKVEPWKYALFANRDFRRAVSFAIDREAMIKGPLFGYGIKNWQLLTAGNPRWYDSTVTAADHDPEQAKKLLDGLGLIDRNNDGVREDAQGHDVAFTIIYNGDNKLRAGMATLMQDDLAKVGIKLTPSGIDFNTLIAKTRADQDYDVCLLGLGSAVPADPGMGANFWKSTGPAHYWNMKQPDGKPDTPAEARINEAFQRNVSSMDLAARKAAYHDMSQTLNDEAFLIWLPTLMMKLPVSSRFGNVQPSPMPHRILWNADVLFVKHPDGKH